MKFDWGSFTEEDYYKYIVENTDDYIGCVYVGDICIDLVNGSYYDENRVELLYYDFYVAHEDTGYAYKNDVLPYDYADGDAMDRPYDLSYEEFKSKAEKLFTDYIVAYKGDYSLVEHANRPLEIW